MNFQSTNWKSFTTLSFLNTAMNWYMKQSSMSSKGSVNSRIWLNRVLSSLKMVMRQSEMEGNFKRRTFHISMRGLVLKSLPNFHFPKQTSKVWYPTEISKTLQIQKYINKSRRRHSDLISFWSMNSTEKRINFKICNW